MLESMQPGQCEGDGASRHSDDTGAQIVEISTSKRVTITRPFGVNGLAVGDFRLRLIVFLLSLLHDPLVRLYVVLDRPFNEERDFRYAVLHGRRFKWEEIALYVVQIKGYYDRGHFGHGFLYTTSLYWALTTITTVGYGDISANTTGEKLFAMVVQIVGVAFFGAMISTFSSVFFAESDEESEKRRLKARIKTFIARHHFPNDLALAVTSFLRRSFDVDRNLGLFSDDDDRTAAQFLKSHLNKPLVRAVALHLVKQDPILYNSNLLSKRDPTFIADCVCAMKASMFTPSEICVPANTVLDAIHVVARGLLQVQDLLSFGPSTHFGHEGLLLKAQWQKPLIATSWTEMSIIRAEDILPLLHRFPNIEKTLRDQATAFVATYPAIFEITFSDDDDDVEEKLLEEEEEKKKAAADTDLQARLDSLQGQMDKILKALTQQKIIIESS